MNGMDADNMSIVIRFTPPYLPCVMKSITGTQRIFSTSAANEAMIISYSEQIRKVIDFFIRRPGDWHMEKPGKKWY